MWDVAFLYLHNLEAQDKLMNTPNSANLNQLAVSDDLHYQAAELTSARRTYHLTNPWNGVPAISLDYTRTRSDVNWRPSWLANLVRVSHHHYSPFGIQPRVSLTPGGRKE